MSEKIWECRIGGDADFLPGGSDFPMRQAVAEAFFKLTGKRAEFCFSGWDGSLNVVERAVVENRPPFPAEKPCGPRGSTGDCGCGQGSDCFGPQVPPAEKLTGTGEVCLRQVKTPTTFWLCPRPLGHKGKCGLKLDTDTPAPQPDRDGGPL